MAWIDAAARTKESSNTNLSFFQKQQEQMVKRQQPQKQQIQARRSQHSSGVYNGNANAGEQLQLKRRGRAAKSPSARTAPAQHTQQAATTIGGNSTVEQLYKNAAQGNDVSQYLLGVRLLYGDGVAKNYNAGVEWLRKSAMQGYEPAREILIKLYQNSLR